MVMFSLHAYLLELIESCTTFDFIDVVIAPLQGLARQTDDKHRGFGWPFVKFAATNSTVWQYVLLVASK